MIYYYMIHSFVQKSRGGLIRRLHLLGILQQKIIEDNGGSLYPHSNLFRYDETRGEQSRYVHPQLHTTESRKTFPAKASSTRSPLLGVKPERRSSKREASVSTLQLECGIKRNSRLGILQVRTLIRCFYILFNTFHRVNSANFVCLNVTICHKL